MFANHNYFEILGLDEGYTLDETQLEENLTRLQSSVHPDNFAQATAQEKRLMMQYSAMLNEAHSVLKDPIKRAIHVLELRGIVIDNDTTQALPPAFLAEQMEMREALEAAQDSRTALKEIEYSLEKALRAQYKALAALLDNHKPQNLVPARDKVFELQFYQKFKKDVQQALHLLEEKSVS